MEDHSSPETKRRPFKRLLQNVMRLATWRVKSETERDGSTDLPSSDNPSSPEEKLPQTLRALLQSAYWPRVNPCRACEQRYMMWTTRGLECGSCDHVELLLPADSLWNIVESECQLAERFREIGTEQLREYLKIHHPNMFTFLWLRRWVPEIHAEVFGDA